MAGNILGGQWKRPGGLKVTGALAFIFHFVKISSPAKTDAGLPSTRK
jgi:hypothetical protein